MSGRAFVPATTPGVTHELWHVTDGRQIGEITRLCAEAKVLIADGHHRYQTARAYATEVRAKNGDQPGPYDLVLAFLVELSEEELSVRTFHRVVKGVPITHLIELVTRFFRIEEAPEDLVALPATSAPGVVVLYTQDGYKLLYPLPAVYEAARDDLDSSRLTVLLDSLPDARGQLRAGMARGRCGGARGPGRGSLLLEAGADRENRSCRRDGAAHATQEHVLPPQAPHREWLSGRSNERTQEPQS